jgi:hypothetical protein
MSLEGIIIGVLGVALGAAFCFAGFRFFLILLPIWGLFTGFMVGAGATATLLGEGFLASTLGIVVGVVVAIVFALLSYLYWWGAVAVIAGALGYWIAHWLLVVIGFSADGWITALIALAAGVLLFVGALVVNAPKYVAIILTSFAGASWLAAGVALFLGVIKPDELPNGSIAAIYTEGWLWIAIWGVAAAAGIIAQLATTSRMEQDLAASMSVRRPY